MKIVHYTNDDDWMELWVDGEMVYQDHIHNFTVKVMVEMLKEHIVPLEYEVVYTDEFT